MGAGAVPDDGGIVIGGMELAGLQVRALESPSRPPVAWVTERDVNLPGLKWAVLSRDAAVTGLQPVLLSSLPGDPSRPWDNGESA